MQRGKIKSNQNIINHSTFSGGYNFKRFQGQPEKKIIEITIPKTVTIPLKQGFRDEVHPEVSPGDSVKAGQVIGRDDDAMSSPIHSTVNGTVNEIKKLEYYEQEVEAITIKSDGTTEWEALEGYSGDWEELSVEKIEKLLYLSGVTSLDRDGIPTHFKSSIISPEEVEHVIVHGVGSEVYNLSLSMLLQEEGIVHFVEGLKIFKKVMPNADIHLAFNEEENNLIDQFSKLLSGFDWINLHVLEPKYPQDYDEILVPTILNESFPYGFRAANIGVVTLNIQTVLHAYEAVVEGKPLIERTIALCGPGVKENPHLKVRVGTTLDHVLEGRIREDKQVRIIFNSPLTGLKLQDLSVPIDRTCLRIVALPEDRTRHFLAFSRPGLKKDAYSKTFLASLLGMEKKADTNLKGEQRPCVSCGFCQEVCPVQIIPHLLYKYVERAIIDEPLMNFEIYKCIECNLCNYVCPSKIPIAQYIVEGKAQMLEEGFDFSSKILPNFDLKGLAKKEEEEEK